MSKLHQPSNQVIHSHTDGFHEVLEVKDGFLYFRTCGFTFKKWFDPEVGTINVWDSNGNNIHCFTKYGIESIQEFRDACFDEDGVLELS